MRSGSERPVDPLVFGTDGLLVGSELLCLSATTAGLIAAIAAGMKVVEMSRGSTLQTHLGSSPYASRSSPLAAVPWLATSGQGGIQG